MNPNVFPGLGQPTSQLYFDIQALIAENGGLACLAEKLECEWLKYYKAPIKKPKQYRFKHYTETEIEQVKANITPTKRTKASMYHKQWWLRKRVLDDHFNGF